MPTYITAFISGGMDPFWPHFILLSVSVLSSFAVAAGIILESPKYPESLHGIANKLVIGGVAIEALCTIGLFVFDEGISNAQQSAIQTQQTTIRDQQADIISLQKSNAYLLAREEELEALTIGARREAAAATERAAQLEKDAAIARASVATANARAAEASQKAAEAELALERLKTPRTLTVARQEFISKAVGPFAGQRYRTAISAAADDGIDFWASLHAALERAGWKYIPIPPGHLSVGIPAAGIPITAAPGVEILLDPSEVTELSPAALALGNALHADGMTVFVNRNDQTNPIEADRDILVIRIGARVPGK
jgi:hypothetical protein